MERCKIKGLTSSEAAERLQRFGKNEAVPHKKQSFLLKVFKVICEPMFLLLISAAIIYFFLGEPTDGAIMLVFVLGMIAIDVVQEWKTDRTLSALRELSAPKVTVIRDGIEIVIPGTELVPDDVFLICEGEKVPADGRIILANDLSIDESMLTGESEAVRKVAADSQDGLSSVCFAATLVTQGSGYAIAEKTGAETEYGKIGVGIASAVDCPTPLQKQTGGLVKLCAGIAAVLFALVTVLTFVNIADHPVGDRITESILSGITLAMAMIPEEFPVILTVFLSMGAWRLAKKKSLVRRLPSVETLGAVSVLCVDKTGTVTENRMALSECRLFTENETLFAEAMGLACEENTYDPMEQAMLAYCEKLGFSKAQLLSEPLVNEYAFTNILKMMGHVRKRGESNYITAKGSPESILGICTLDSSEKLAAEAAAAELSSKGLRVIAVAAGYYENGTPEKLTDCRLNFLGLAGLADPPRKGVKENIESCRQAGIRVVMITGDNGITAAAIGRQVGIDSESIITGDEIDRMTDDELCLAVRRVSVFSRVVPEHKMRIVKAFQTNGEIVAMTGDGVNDAPALKYADIGIAMGGRGSEVSREAADLILLDDNFSTIVSTVRDGRRIYDNIRRAVGYVFTVHIPIALASLLAPFLHIAPDCLMLLPLHVVLLELIIDPTCSVVLERQPAEDDIMSRPPRAKSAKILDLRTLIKSFAQGLALFAGSFGIYYFTMQGGGSAELARALGLAVIMFGNLLLVHVNCSEHDFAVHSAKHLSRDKVMWAVTAVTVLLLAAVLYTPLTGFLKLQSPTVLQLVIAIAVSAVSVLWYEVVKLIKQIIRK